MCVCHCWIHVHSFGTQFEKIQAPTGLRCVSLNTELRGKLLLGSMLVYFQVLMFVKVPYLQVPFVWLFPLCCHITALYCLAYKAWMSRFILCLMCQRKKLSCMPLRQRDKSLHFIMGWKLRRNFFLLHFIFFGLRLIKALYDMTNVCRLNI